MGVKITAVPVGQGTMNIVHEYDGAGKLIYLALLDCGGDSADSRKRPPNAKLFRMLRELMQERAKGEDLDVDVHYYIDELIISHRDSDHINFLKTDYLFQDVCFEPHEEETDFGETKRSTSNMGSLNTDPASTVSSGMSTLFSEDNTAVNDIRTGGLCKDSNGNDMGIIFRHTDGYFSSYPPGAGNILKICDTYEAVHEYETVSGTMGMVCRYVVTHSHEKEAYKASFLVKHTTNDSIMEFSADCHPNLFGSEYNINMSTDIQVNIDSPLYKQYSIDMNNMYGFDGNYYVLLFFTSSKDVKLKGDKRLQTLIPTPPRDIPSAVTLLIQAMDKCVKCFIPDPSELQDYKVLSSLTPFYFQMYEHIKKSDYNYKSKTAGELFAELFPPSINALPKDGGEKKLKIGNIYLGGMDKGQSTMFEGVQKTLEKLLPDGGKIKNINKGLINDIEFTQSKKLSRYMIGTPDICYRNVTNRLFGYAADKAKKLRSKKSTQNGCSIITIYYHNEEEYKCVLPGDATTLTAEHFNFKIKKEFQEKKAFEKMDGAPSSFMAPHHGSCTTMTMDVLEDFLININAKRIGISAGVKNSHALPNCSFIKTCIEYLKDTDAGEHYLYYNTTDHKETCIWKDDGTTDKHLYTLFCKVSADKGVGAYELTYEDSTVTNECLDEGPFPPAPTVGTTVRTEPNESAQQNILRLRNTFDFVYER